MISKYRSNWFAHGLAAAILAVGFTAACSDDGGTVLPPDSGPDDPDAPPCEGHTCPPTSQTMTLPEGGEIRYELFHVGYDPDTGEKVESLGGWAFAFKGQSPLTRPIVGLAVEGIGYPAEFANAYCFDHRALEYYLNGWSQRGQEIADTRTYYDLGPELTLISENGLEIPMPRQAPGSIDPSTLLQHDTLYLTDPGLPQARELERNVQYPALQIAPVNDFPGLDLRGGYDALLREDELDPPAMYFPADFTLDSPTEQEYFAADTGLVIDPAQDLTFTWTHDGEFPAGWPGQVQFTGFLTAEQTFQYLCITPDNGTQVIPAGLFTQPDFPQTGKLIHGSLTHMAWAQHVADDEEYRFDLIGVNCKFSTYTLQTP